MTVPVHASISGVVKKIEPRLQSNNTEGPCIIIEHDGNEATAFMPPLDVMTCSHDEAIARLKDAGLTGMGGAGFPTHVKLNPPPAKHVDTLLANAAECEPYLTTDEALIGEKTDTLIKGIAIVMKITGVQQAVIGMEDNKAEMVPVIEAAIERAGLTGKARVGLCKTRYPQGGEKMLITVLTGREVPSGGLPMDAGCIVQNVGSLVAVAEAFTLGKPLIDRDLTVSGGACLMPKNIRAPIGTVFSSLPKEFIDVDHGKLRKILFGGPMMGTAVPHMDIPIQKNTSGVTLLTAEETYANAEGPCIHCARCVNTCPCRLAPALINDALIAGDLDDALWAGLMDCIECGACTYMCPARIKLVQRFRVGKLRLRTRMAAQQAAQKAKADAAAKAAAAPAPAKA
jgi:electron transport complex protein RnfC